MLNTENFNAASSTAVYDNSFVMKYLLDKDNTYKCLYDGATDMPGSDFVTPMRSVETSQSKDLQLTDETITYNNYFKVYFSPYSGAFDLLDTMYIPRPCAQAAANLTQLDYFYGQRAKNYSMRLEPSYKQRATTVLSQMTSDREFVFQNGSACSRFAWLGNDTLGKNTTLWVQTDDENLVGTQRTVLRGCNSMNQLLEINFYVNVTSNSAPEFVEDIQTQWNINVGDKINYTLPKFRDPEGNDVG